MTKVGSLRASDADREQTISQLHKAATEGRIGSDELEQRVAAALKARTYGELDAIVSDLPRQLNHRPRRAPSRKRATAGWAVHTVRANPLLLLFVIPVLAVTFAMVVAATVLWTVLMVVATVMGGGHSCRRGRVVRGPLTYSRLGRGYGPPRRSSARSYWA